METMEKGIVSNDWKKVSNVLTEIDVKTAGKVSGVADTPPILAERAIIDGGSTIDILTEIRKDIMNNPEIDNKIKNKIIQKINEIVELNKRYKKVMDIVN